MKNIITSILLTLSIGFIIILAQLFTRESTLDGVRDIDFNLVYAFINEKSPPNSSHIEKALKTLSYKNQVLFPMAVLTKDSCVDNSFENSTKEICKKIKSYANFKNYLSEQKAIKIDDKNYLNHSSKFFIYKEFTNFDGYLIGHAGKYIFGDDSEILKFIYFLKNDFKNLISSQEGRETLWQESRTFAFIILIISAILSYFYLKRIKRNLHRYRLLMDERARDKKEWGTALDEQKKIQNTLEEKDNLLALKYQELEELKHHPNQEIDELSKTIDELESSKESVLSNLENSKEKIITLEKKEDSLIKTILAQSKRLAKKDATTANESTYYELNSLKKLWRVEPQWYQRSKIESSVATDNGQTPFTITQAFISFDNYILQKAKRARYKSLENEDLYGAINFLYKNNFLSVADKNIFHKIRIKRNEWFHNGKYPNKIIIKKLLELLELQNQKPLL